MVKGKPLLQQMLRCPGMHDNADSNDLCEYVATVRWIKTVDRSQAKWEPKAGLYTTTHVRASLDGQAKTVAFLEAAFGVNLKGYVR